MQDNVAPLAGAWIEIYVISGRSHPASVAPLAGAWIEIVASAIVETFAIVAPLAGAWIEITEEHTIFHHGPESLPSRERGLKLIGFLWISCIPRRSPRGSVD